MWRATEQYINSATEAERLGYDSFWTTEHHFQHEGYEVIPNGIQLSTWIAARTERIRLGTMFNVVPQWHPLRLAEDFSTLHNLSGGRGDPRRRARHRAARGAAPQREARVDRLATTTPTSRPTMPTTARCSRSRWRSSACALANESFAYHGKHFQFPMPGIPDRGATVQELTLVPRPAVPVRDLAGGHQPADARVRPGRRPRRGVLEPALQLHQALLGHLRRPATPTPTTAPSWRPATSACS